MKRKRVVAICLTGIALAVGAPSGLADEDDRERPATGLVREVRLATEAFRDVNAAMAAGYSSTSSCVSGPEVGAMGVHFANGQLIGDGALDASLPELLMYEQRNGRLRLLGVEYLVIAAQWHIANPAPPVLMGQHFQYVGSPNRYGLPPFYELHVWAWRDNPHGMFVDWNPRVSCEEFTGTEAIQAAAGHDGH